MTRITITILLVVLTGLQNPAFADEAAVLEVEDQWIQAELNNDGSTLRRIIDDRFVINNNDGTTSTKEDLIESALVWNMTDQTLSERTVLVDGDVAVVFGSTVLEFRSAQGEDTESFLRYTTVYVRREQGWRALALHMAPHRTE